MTATCQSTAVPHDLEHSHIYKSHLVGYYVTSFPELLSP